MANTKFKIGAQDKRQLRLGTKLKSTSINLLETADYSLRLLSASVRGLHAMVADASSDAIIDYQLGRADKINQLIAAGFEENEAQKLLTL